MPQASVTNNDGRKLTLYADASRVWISITNADGGATGFQFDTLEQIPVDFTHSLHA